MEFDVSLVWLFKEYRDQYLQTQVLEREILEQRAIIEKYKTHECPAAPNFDAMIQEFQDKLLTEQPFVDNAVPESYYLTPAGSE